MLKFLKYFSILLLVSLLIFAGCAVYIYQNLRASTPSLPDLAKNLNSFSSAIAFNYSKNIDRQMYLFSKNIGLENNPYTKQEEPKDGNIGANGFFIFDVRAGKSQYLFSKLDSVLNDMLDFLNESIVDNKEYEKKLVVDETETNMFESPFVTPLSSFIEEIWNGQTFVIGGATQFYLSLKDTFLLALEPYTRNYIRLSSNFFRDMIIKNAPMYVQDFLSKHSINVGIEPAITKLDTSIQESEITLSIDDSREFLNSICSTRINPWDLCGRFSLNRLNFRKTAQSLLGLVSQNFKVTFKIYWTVRGKDIIYSNHKDFVNKLLNPVKDADFNNVLTDVASSGDDYLFASRHNLKYTSLSLYFDMIQSQNEAISFVESLRKHSQVMADYFASPNGEIAFSGLEKSINEITRFSQKASLSFHTDGQTLLPELRLYSPSSDLFINEGKMLSPEFVNSMRVFVTKGISFGNYLLPRGLLPIPGPFMTRNGRWVILKSDIAIKSIAPYLESINPYIDPNDVPSKL